MENKIENLEKSSQNKETNSINDCSKVCAFYAQIICIPYM